MACAKLTGDRLVILKDGVMVAEGSYAALEKSDDAWVRSFFI
jgi:phospholipid/cholesterol/gamma-HCH transport system ATP-binding protein